MPVEGKSVSTNYSRPKRVLRADTKRNVFKDFFVDSRIPDVDSLFVECYINSIIDNREQSEDLSNTNQDTETDISEDEIFNIEETIEEPAQPFTRIAGISDLPPESIEFVDSGIFAGTHTESSEKKPFKFPFPVHAKDLLDKRRDFLIPPTIYNPTNPKKPSWRNLTKSTFVN